jgi:hypothetical protein
MRELPRDQSDLIFLAQNIYKLLQTQTDYCIRFIRVADLFSEMGCLELVPHHVDLVLLP